jgi:choline dehydrogenase-like flavoprotein
MPGAERVATEVLVVGSGAGGATVARTLAELGHDVLVLEEGHRVPAARYGGSSAEAFSTFYRNRGMTPILGPIPIGFVEGACVGGSTEVNSGFWHRTPAETLIRWNAVYGMEDIGPDAMAPHFLWAEDALGVGTFPGPLPPSTQVFQRGAQAMGWAAKEVPRTAPGCRESNVCAMGCPTGSKQGMTARMLPAAEAHGARVLSSCRAEAILHDKGRVTGVLAVIRDRTHGPDGRQKDAMSWVRIEAEHVFVCAGPTQTPALLRRSGITFHVGNTLAIHPMMKVAARFSEPMDADRHVLPLLQVREFLPEITLGGAFFSPGHLAMLLADGGPRSLDAMLEARHMATYYVAVRGTGTGTVRPSALSSGGTRVRYTMSSSELENLGRGIARLSLLLLRAGAVEVYPGLVGASPVRTEKEAGRWLDGRLDRSRVAATTVHAFSSCPSGETRERCAADSWGRVYGFENLRVADASMLPDSPGVNPQGSIMALARRNALHFHDLAA